MSILHMVACGMLDLTRLTRDERRAAQQAAKFAAHDMGYWISGCKSEFCCTTMEPTDGSYRPITERGGPHRLTRWSKKSFRNHGRPALSERTAQRGAVKCGNFVECCAALTQIITPSNHEEL